MSKLFIIGARTLVGDRLYQWLGPQRATYSTRTPTREAEIALDLKATQSLAIPPVEEVIVTVPIWLLSEAALGALTAAGMRRLVAFSSTSRFSKTDSAQEVERAVAERLAAAEGRVMSFCAANDVGWTILRPTLIYDEGRDENISRIHRFMDRFGFFPVCDEASGLRQPVHARDLAVAAVAACGSAAARNKAYNLGGGEALTYAAMVARTGSRDGRQGRVLRLPEWLWQGVFIVAGWLKPGQALKTNLEMARRMNADLVFDSSEAVRDFGYAPSPFRPRFDVPTPYNE